MLNQKSRLGDDIKEGWQGRLAEVPDFSGEHTRPACLGWRPADPSSIVGRLRRAIPTDGDDAPAFRWWSVAQAFQPVNRLKRLKSLCHTSKRHEIVMIATLRALRQEQVGMARRAVR